MELINKLSSFFNKKIELPDNIDGFSSPNSIDIKAAKYLEESFKFGAAGIFYGFTDIMPNPDPVLKRMGLGKDVDYYKDILTDPQLFGAIENNRKPGVTSLLMYLDNPDCSKDELEFFNKYFDLLISKGIYDNITNQTLDTPQFGRTVFGLVWQKVNNAFLPVNIAQIPASNCKFNNEGELLILNEYGSFEKPQHPARFIVLRNKPTLENPYGENLLSRCFWNVRFKKDGLKLWALFTEKFGMPWVKASYDPIAIKKFYNTEPTAAATLLLQQLSVMAKDGIIVFPDGTSVDIASSGRTDNSEIYEKLVRICDEQNTKLQLGHSGATESTSGDKLSNDTTATEVRKNVIDSDKKFPITFWNKLIDWIHIFNFSGNEKPRFDLYAKEEVDMNWAERDAKLVPVFTLAGMKPTPEYLKKTYGFEDEDLEISISEPATTFSNQLTNNNKNIKESTAGIQQLSALKDMYKAYLNKFHSESDANQTTFNDQNLIDKQADDAEQNSVFQNTILNFIVAKLDGYDNFDDAQRELPYILNEINTQDFEEYLEKLLFSAEILGRFSVKDEVIDE